MICTLCQRQIGLRSAHHAHTKLGAPGASGTRGFRVSANQKLYACADCDTVLVKGRNTGWSAAVPLDG